MPEDLLAVDHIGPFFDSAGRCCGWWNMTTMKGTLDADDLIRDGMYEEMKRLQDTD